MEKLNVIKVKCIEVVHVKDFKIYGVKLQFDPLDEYHKRDGNHPIMFTGPFTMSIPEGYEDLIPHVGDNYFITLAKVIQQD